MAKEYVVQDLEDENRTLKEDVEFLGAIHETDRKRIEKLEETISILRSQLEDEADKNFFAQQELNRLKPDNSREKNPRHKLTEGQVKEIRERYVPYKVSTYKLAKEYGVTQQNVSYIVNNKSWRT